ncbi:unnamed protein product [Pleuronectes platessa]|uniref:Uncharacterized protein n=1 Tax=Pleuronectes platessa TaxID=8262 RepID=A0A9N7ZCP1_PLEPL|nr:unnamed protein product [Pleuronectes platessa]
MLMRFQIVHVPLPNSKHNLQVSTWLSAQQHAAEPPACQSTDTEFDWFTFGKRLSGQNALCLLIPAQSATGPSHPGVNQSLRERATVPGQKGVSRPPEIAEVQPLQAERSHLHLRGEGHLGRAAGGDQQINTASSHQWQHCAALSSSSSSVFEDFCSFFQKLLQRGNVELQTDMVTVLVDSSEVERFGDGDDSSFEASSLSHNLHPHGAYVSLLSAFQSKPSLH